MPRMRWVRARSHNPSCVRADLPLAPYCAGRIDCLRGAARVVLLKPAPPVQEILGLRPGSERERYFR